MYLNSSSKDYEKKYLKYKNKYKILKSNIGGNCDPLPNPKEDDFSGSFNLLDLCPEERITIQNKCYEVNGLYRWITKHAKDDRLPDTRQLITEQEKEKIIQTYYTLHPELAQNYFVRDDSDNSDGSDGYPSDFDFDEYYR